MQYSIKLVEYVMVNEQILSSLLVQPINSILNNVQRSSLKHQIAMTKDGPYIHIDRGGSILAVCHLDYVKFSQYPKFDYLKGEPIFVRAGQLDDRLGLYIITHHLQQYTNIKYDILLTDSEEEGKSTAKDFVPTKEYNWMFSFDREGTDTVLYKYQSDELKSRLEYFGLNVGFGSFSDISFLGHLNIKGMNIGTGYYKSHTMDSYADLEEMDDNVKKFANFIERFHNTKMYHDASMDYQRTYGNYNWSQYSYESNDVIDMDQWQTSMCQCGVCSEDFVYEANMLFCPYCGNMLDDTASFEVEE